MSLSKTSQGLEFLTTVVRVQLSLAAEKGIGTAASPEEASGPRGHWVLPYRITEKQQACQAVSAGPTLHG